MLYRSIKPFDGRVHLLGSMVLVAVMLRLLAGCAIQRPVPPTGGRTVPNASFALLDQRPADERTTRWLSPVVYTCASNVRQYGDEAISPDRFAVLAESLNASLHERLVGKALRVTHFGIYVNSSHRSRASDAIRGEGLVRSLSDYAMVNRFDHLCTAEEMAAGWRDPGDPDTTHAIAIVRITLIVEGTAHSVRVFEKADAAGMSAAIVSAIRTASERLITDIVATPSVTTSATR